MAKGPTYSGRQPYCTYRCRNDNQQNCKDNRSLRKGAWPPLDRLPIFKHGIWLSLSERILNLYTCWCSSPKIVIFYTIYIFCGMFLWVKLSPKLSIVFKWFSTESQDIKFNESTHPTFKMDKCKLALSHILQPPPPSTPHESAWPTRCLQRLVKTLPMPVYSILLSQKEWHIEVWPSSRQPKLCSLMLIPRSN